MVGYYFLTVFSVAFVAYACHSLDVSVVLLRFLVQETFNGEGEAEIVVIKIELEVRIYATCFNKGSDLRIVSLYQL